VSGPLVPGPGRRIALGERFGAVAPVVLAILAEAAWITVLAGLLQEYVLAYPILELPVLALIAAAGAIAAKLLGPRLGGRWPAAATILTIGIGAAGWLVAPDARAALVRGDILAAIGAHPGGWLAGLAFLRGTAYDRVPISEPRLARMLTAGIAGLAVTAIAGGMISEPYRGRFLADALTGTTVFAASATLGLALARITSIGVDAGFDWRRNPVWAALLVVLVLATAGVALPASRVAAPIVTLVVGAAIGPLLLVALIAGFSRRTVWVMGLAALFMVAILGLLTVFGVQRAPTTVTGGGAGGPTEAPVPPPPEAVIAGAVIVLLVAIIAIVVLVRLWGRRQPVEDESVGEIRTIDRGDATPARRRRWRWRRSPAPTDAVAAYRALDADLARLPAVRRDPAETPGEHARRLRATGRAGLALDLLAADYALARFGDRPLSGAEHQRAVARWRSLRSRLRAGEPRRSLAGDQDGSDIR
jgi:Domain of unknown function (DUF4129)